jgi:hypothetical protein
MLSSSTGTVPRALRLCADTRGRAKRGPKNIPSLLRGIARVEPGSDPDLQLGMPLTQLLDSIADVQCTDIRTTTGDECGQQPVTK